MNIYGSERVSPKARTNDDTLERAAEGRRPRHAPGPERTRSRRTFKRKARAAGKTECRVQE